MADVSFDFVGSGAVFLFLENAIEVPDILSVCRAVELPEDLQLLLKALQSFVVLLVQIEHADDPFGAELHARFDLVFEVVVHESAINAGPSLEREVGLWVGRKETLK